MVALLLFVFLLRPLACGYNFYQSKESVTSSANLLTLTSGSRYNQRLENVMLPDNLRTMTFGAMFNQFFGRCHVARLPGDIDFRRSFQLEF